MDSPSEGRQPKRRCLDGVWQVPMAEVPTQARLMQPIYSSRSLPGFQQPNSTQWQASALETASLSHLTLPAYHNIGRSTPLLQQYSSPILENHHQGLLTAEPLPEKPKHLHTSLPGIGLLTAEPLPEKPKQLHTSLPGISTIETPGYCTGNTRYGSQVHNPIPAFMSNQTKPQRVGGLYFGANQPVLPGFYDSNPAYEHLHPPSRANGAISDTTMSMEAPSAELVCFGMVPALEGTYERRNAQDLPPDFLVEMKSAECFEAVDNKQVRGRLHTDYGQMVQGLLDDEMLKLFVVCSPSRVGRNLQKPSKFSAAVPCSLEVVVYGPSDLSEEMGSWFQDYDVYLQDPRVCHLDARYCNPHRLSFDELTRCSLLSEVVSKPPSLVQLSEVCLKPDLLDTLSGNPNLEETCQPTSIISTLKKHQRQALTFMLCRERGWGFGQIEKRPNMWEIVDSTQTRQYLNVISDSSQSEEPDDFAGGIVADPMGLGKTLTMISLIALDLETNDPLQSWPRAVMSVKVNVSATLIIIPPPLIGTWEDELNTHVATGTMPHRRHHGKYRIRSLDELDDISVVLATYHTVSAEWKTEGTKQDSILFAARWKRIILDEAHFIRNAKSRMAKAACALDAKSRWAVSGTPIQNRLSDLAALLQFVRAYPYDDPRCFDADITNLWKTGEEAEAVRRLKRLSSCLLLRRPKNIIGLPARRDLVSPVDFTRDERTVYEKMRMQTVSRLDQALYGNPGSSKASSYMNVLQQIESLRLFCNLGLCYQARHAQHEKSSLEVPTQDWSVTAQRAFHAQREMNPMVCHQCASVLEISEILLDGDTSPQVAHFSSCMRFACADCTSKLNRHNRAFKCGHKIPCPTALVSLSGAALDDSPSLDGFDLDSAPDGLSSKVQALVSELKTRPHDEKCVIFSTWRLTLDMVQRGLEDAGIACVRFDGKVPQKDRQPIVERFKTDPGLRVMLLTLSCGATGLTLTVASRAYLMEPHWNPTLEEQALARIHRLGQTKEVTTIRLYIRDSFEEKVMELQESKRSLASVLLSPHDGGQTEESNQSELQKLRALL